MHNLNRTFFYSVSAALALTGLSIFVRVHLLLAVGFELAPLVYYFYTLDQRARTESLSQTAIDSVYYFGFIITIFALAASVFRVYFLGFGNDLVGIVGHFAVGLLATGLALLFRMLLTARTEALNAKDLGESIEDYIRRVNDVVTSVEASAANFEGLAQSLQDRTEKVISAAHLSFSTSLTESSRVFQEQIKQIIGKAEEAVQEFHGTVEAVTNSSHVEDFDANMSQIVGGLRNFAKEMTVYGQRLTQDAVAANANALSVTNKSFMEHLQALYAKNGDLVAKGLAQIQQLDFSEEASTIKGDLQALSRSITGFGKKFGELENRLSQTVATQSAQAAQGVIDKFAGEIVRIVRGMEESLGESSSEVVKNLNAVAATKVAAIGDAVSNGVTRQVGQVSGEVSAVSQALQELRASLDSTRQARENDELAVVVSKTRGLLDQLNTALASAVAHCNSIASQPAAVEAVVIDQRRESFLSGVGSGTF
jgi:HAMP domain-containing protein